jgi:hypothetical protein
VSAARFVAAAGRHVVAVAPVVLAVGDAPLSVLVALMVRWCAYVW